MKAKRTLCFILCVMSVLAFAPFKSVNAGVSPQKYTAAYIATQEQADTVDSLTALNDAHTFYTLEYTADYKLDELLTDGVSNLAELTLWIQQKLLGIQSGAVINMDAGCSAFAVKNREGELVYGRNYDYVQNAQNILVHTTPANGDYESYSLCAGGWLFTEGTLDSGEADLSMLVAAPYLLMDGMNEKGFIVSVLKLDGAGTAQADETKNDIMTTVALRLMLDKAATVEEALTLISKYNMHSAMPAANFHFYLADANGHYCVLEFEPGNGGVSAKGFFDAAADFPACTDEAHEYAQVTNFYRLYSGCDDGQHGLDRYEILTERLKNADYTLSEKEAMELLSEVYQDFGETSTHETQWSVVYNPVDFTAEFCMRAQQSDTADIFYDTCFSFDFSKQFNGAGAATYKVSSPETRRKTALTYGGLALVVLAAAAVYFTRRKKNKS